MLTVTYMCRHFIENKYENRKLKRVGRGHSVHERLWIIREYIGSTHIRSCKIV